MKNVMTIDKIINNNLCTGCGTCVSLCPQNAIVIEENKKKGINIPKIIKKKCIGCEVCYKICPGQEVDFVKLNAHIFGTQPSDLMLGNYSGCYIGYTPNYEIRYNATSGGVITELLIFALECGIIDGAVVTRMSTNDPLRPESFIARTKDEIIAASKSKYCPVPTNIVIKEIESSEGEKFAFVGLPCQIHGLRKAELLFPKIKDKIIMHFGIFCNHTPSYLATDYLLKQLKIKKDYIESLNYRGNGWPGKMKIQLKNGEQLELGEYWGNGFGQYFLPYRCTLCYDHTAELADISFGDAWIPEIQSKDKIGSSIIVLRNNKYNEFLQKAAMVGRINIKSVNNTAVIQSQKDSLRFKKEYLNTRLVLLKLFKKPTPVYYRWGITKSNITAIFPTVNLYIKLFFASKKKLWNILYCLNAFRSLLAKAIRQVLLIKKK